MIGVSGDSFNLTCGCEALTNTMGEFGCGSTDNFTITSGQLPTLDGCYLYTGDMNSTSFSQTGELIVGEVAVYMGYMNSEEPDVSARRRKVPQGLPIYGPTTIYPPFCDVSVLFLFCHLLCRIKARINGMQLLKEGVFGFR